MIKGILKSYSTANGEVTIAVNEFEANDLMKMEEGIGRDMFALVPYPIQIEDVKED